MLFIACMANGLLPETCQCSFMEAPSFHSHDVRKPFYLRTASVASWRSIIPTSRAALFEARTTNEREEGLVPLSGRSGPRKVHHMHSGRVARAASRLFGT